MKKLFALVLALCLCVASVAALAETVELNIDPTFEAALLPITEDGVGILIPADSTDEGTNDTGATVYCVAEGIYVAVTISTASVDENIAALAGMGYQQMNAVINGIGYAMFESADKTDTRALTALGDCTLMIAFVSPADYSGTLPAEILGSLGVYAE